MPTAEECWAADLLTSPIRERWTYVSHRMNIISAHVARLRAELDTAATGKAPPADALRRIEILRGWLDRTERELIAIGSVSGG